MISPAEEPPSRMRVTYHPAFVEELQAMKLNVARELVKTIKRAFQRADWEKFTLNPMNDKRVFYLPKVGDFTIVGGKVGKEEVILLTARRS